MASGLQERIFVNFFKEVDQIVQSLQELKGKSDVDNINMTEATVERLVEINRDLDDLIVKLENVDQEVLLNTVKRSEEDERRYQEYKKQEELINTFLPAMMSYSIAKNDDK